MRNPERERERVKRFSLKKAISLPLIVLLIFQMIGGFFVFPQKVQAAAQTWALSSSSGYTFDSDKVEISSGQAQLKQIITPWYSADWDYRKIVTIDNTGNASDLANYQIKAIVTYDSNMQADFDDIRFTNSDGTTLLDHWLESKTNSTTATYWIEVPSISASSSKTIYMYYGNSGTFSASNADNTFQFFDDSFLSLNTSTPLTNISSAAVMPEIYPGITEAVHPDVAYFENNWNGYKYWMVFTPMPSPYEFPSIVVSQDGTTWIEPPGINNPIDGIGVGAGSYHADTDLFYNEDTDELWVYYMGYEGNYNYTLRSKSSDGITWSDQEIVLTVDKSSIGGVASLISPTVVKVNSTYHIWYSQGSSPNLTLKHRTSSDGANWSAEEDTVFLESPSDLWHQDVIYVPSKSEYWMMGPLPSNGNYDYLIFATSKDGINWTVYDDNPALNKAGSGWDSASVYRASMVYYPDTDKIRVWYSGTSGVWPIVWKIGSGYIEKDYSDFLDTLNEKWTQHKQGSSSAVITQTSGVLRLAGAPNVNSSANVKSIQTFTNDIVIEIRKYADNAVYRDASLGAGDLVDQSGGAANWYHTTLASGYNWWTNSDAVSGVARVPASGGVAGLGTFAGLGTGSSYETHKFIYDSSGNLKWYVDDVLKHSATNTAFLSDAKRLLISQGEFTNGNGGNSYVDWVRVRGYASTEPSITVGSEVAVYPSDNPTIQPTAANSLAFTSLDSFAETATKNGGQIKYILSNDDGVTWQYYNSGWTTSDGTYSQSNTSTEINTNIAAFSIGDGEFLWKAFLDSDGAQLVQLDSIAVTGVPLAPTATTPTTITSSSISWSFSDNSSDETGFKVYDSANTLMASDATADIVNINETGLLENTQYSRYIKAYNGSGNSLASSTSTVYTLADTPTNLAVDTVGQTAIILSVDAINNPTADFSGYYFSNTTNSTNSGWIQTNTWENTGLTCGTSYDYTVKYRNGDGTETDTIALTQATSACDDEADDLEISDVEYSSTKNTITIKWETNNDADSKVEYGKDINMDKDKEDDDNEENHKIILKDLDPDTLYYFKIKSEDENGSSDSSDRKSIKTKKEDATSGFFNNSFTAPGENNSQNEKENIVEKIGELPEKIMEKAEELDFFKADIFKKEDKKYLSEVKFQIKDEQDNPLPNMEITLHSDPQTTVTDSNGYATFKNVETGNHTLAFNYNNQSRKLAVNINEPKTESGEVKVETIVIKVAEKRNDWIYYLVAFLIAVIAFLIFRLKRKKIDKKVNSAK